MMTPLLFLSTFLLLLVAADPQTASVELIFPRNSTYLSVYPFPVSFALRNAAAISPYSFHFSYTLRVSAQDPHYRDGSRYSRWDYFHESAFHLHDDYSDSLIPLPCCPDVPANTTDDVIITHASATKNLPKNARVELQWRIGLGHNCSTDTTIPYERRIDNPPLIEGILYFTLDDEGGVLPNITAEKKALRVGEYTIQEQFTPVEKFPCMARVPGACAIDVCPVLSPGEKQGTVFDPSKDPEDAGENEGAMDITEATAAEVIKGMLRAVKCEGKKWPNPTATSCGDLESGASRVEMAVVLMGLLGVVTAGLLVLG